MTIDRRGFLARGGQLAAAAAVGSSVPGPSAQTVAEVRDGGAEAITVTWWGCMSTEVNFGDVNIIFDPYVKPVEPRFDYIFCSHDHYDHCHEPTLRQLIVPEGKHFKMLFASRGCFYASRLQSPNNWGPTLLSDLNYVPRDKAIALYPKYRADEDPDFPGPTEVQAGRFRVEGFRSGEDPRPHRAFNDHVELQFNELAGPWPNMGYLVTDTVTGRSLAHCGDITRAVPQMERMRGKVDVLFYPLGKLNMEEKTKMMQWMQPTVAVPVHYRLFEPDFPIPANFPRGESPFKDDATLKKFCLGHWYPSPEDPPKEIRVQREAFRQWTRVVELKAGQQYVVPDDLSELKGRQR